MCEYIKSRFPHIYLYTSTNGLMFTEESAKRLVHSGIDEVTFSSTAPLRTPTSSTASEANSTWRFATSA